MLRKLLAREPKRQTLKQAILERLITNCLGGVIGMLFLATIHAHIQITEALQSGMLIFGILHMFGG